MRYETIREVLEMFAVQHGFSDELAVQLVQEAFAVPGTRKRLETELEALVADPTAPWLDLVENDVYEIEEPDDTADARRIVLRILWPLVFADRAIPNGPVSPPAR